MRSMFKKVSKLLYQIGFMKRVKSERSIWQDQAQHFEFNFHKDNEFRQSSDFFHETEKLLSSFGFTPTDFEDKVILDLGAGSKLRSKFFLNTKIIALEPLATKFISEIDWCDLKDSWRVYSKPAEEFIPDLENSVDFIMSINVLDHCYDFQKIIDNSFHYLISGGLAFLSFDKHLETNEGHPLILTEGVCNKIFQVVGFQIERFTTGFPSEFSSYYPGRRGYGGKKTTSLNYWLRKGT